MHLQLARLSGALGAGGYEVETQSRDGDGAVTEGVGEGLLEMRSVEFAGHLRRPYHVPGTEKMEFLDAMRDYVRFVYTVVGLWKGVRTIVIAMDRSPFEFAGTLRHGFELDYELGQPVLEEHELICDEGCHEDCEREAGKWRPVDASCDGLEVVLWLVRKSSDGEKGDGNERRVEIRCKESPDGAWGGVLDLRPGLRR